ncbi:MAG: hypothetical protein ACI8ZX_000119 [Planctomycetota bacterium]|jgi:hypothetical protein
MFKEGKVFWMRLFGFILFVFLIDVLAGKIFFQLENKALKNSPFAMVSEYTMWEVDKEVILIGASETTHGLVPSVLQDSLDMSVYNCGKDGYRFHYQSSMIDGILKRYSPKLIIWSVSSSFLSRPSENDIDRLSNLNVFYHNNDYIKRIINNNKGPYENYKLNSQLYTYNSRLMPYLYKIISNDYSFEKGGFAPLINKGNVYPEKQYSNIEDNLDNEVAELFTITLEKLKAAGTKVVLLFPPRLQISNFKSTTQYNELKRIAEKFDTPIIDKFYNHKDFINDSTMFKDIGHLNKTGAHKFSGLISSELKNLIIDKQ